MSYRKIKTQEEIIQNLMSRFGEKFHSLKDLPPPFALKGMEKAALRIKKAIENKETIYIVGDYDVDGTSSVAQLVLFFEYISYPVAWTVPNRFTEGYGLSPKIIDRIGEPDVIITVDNGISAIEAADICAERGIDLIITDHHIAPDILPEAYTIVNQKQKDCTFPYDEICGGQIAWYLVAAMKKVMKLKDLEMRDYLDIATLATIADVMPLTEINRAFVISGLKQMGVSSRPAFRVFREAKNVSVPKAEDIGFFLGPIINSAGRMDSADHAIKFLIAKTDAEAITAFQKLVSFNEDRKETEKNITESAKTKISEKDKFIIVEGNDLHEGVVGIVAARIARDYERPCLVLNRGENGILKGSGRTYGNIDLFSILSEAKDLFDKFGGHAAAAGLSMPAENLPRVKEIIAREMENPKHNKEYIDPAIIGFLDFSMIELNLLSAIDRFEPFGEGNPSPKFIQDVEVASFALMGSDKSHSRFSFSQNGREFTGVRFKSDEPFEVGEKVRIIFLLNKNEFRGNVSIQLMIEKITRL